MLVLALLLACQPEPSATDGLTDAGRFQLTWELLPDPPVTGPATFTVWVADPDGVSVDGSVAVEPWMPSMGHGVSGDVVVEALGDGAYATGWTWSMPGRWEITVSVDDGHAKDTLTFPVDVD